MTVVWADVQFLYISANVQSHATAVFSTTDMYVKISIWAKSGVALELGTWHTSMHSGGRYAYTLHSSDHCDKQPIESIGPNMCQFHGALFTLRQF